MDSGVFPEHPHVGGVAGGVAIRSDGSESDDWLDRLGHGTAVAAAIREKVPEAELLAVRVFEQALTSDIGVLIRGIEWAVRQDCHLINLSLGTSRPEHEARLRTVVEWATGEGAIVVAAGEDGQVRWLPGSLPLAGVVGVQVDWSSPRDACRVEVADDGQVTCRASGYPREIPGVPPERNLKGLSFAVANVTGLAARVIGWHQPATFEQFVSLLGTPSTSPGPGLLGFSATC